MAYQSQFSGKQIDEVINICRTGENLNYLSELSESMKIIQEYSDNITQIDSEIDKIKKEMQSQLSLDGGTVNGQIIKLTDCNYYEARDKSLIKVAGYDNNNQPKVTDSYSPIYSCATTDGDISHGLIATGENPNTHKIVWRYISNSDYKNNNNANSKELASITMLGQIVGGNWNDYAEYRESPETEPGRVVCEYGNGILKRSTKRLQPGAEIVSDTFGFAIGNTVKCNTPIAVSGRVLAFPNEELNKYKPGDPVCAGPNGTVSKMSRREVRKYPDRIVGIVSEIPTYETWSEHNIKINGRIWIRIK